MNTKNCDVAGSFYPAEEDVVRQMIEKFLTEGKGQVEGKLRGLVIPHAGYIYSGPIAGSAYKCLKENYPHLKKIVLFGPCHRTYVEGMAFHEAEEFQTPLGNLQVDRKTLEKLKKFSFVHEYSEAFHLEHSVEVHLPFIAYLYPQAEILPFVVGQSSPDEIFEVIEFLTKEIDPFFIISSDLSHFHSYEVAKEKDHMTSDHIVKLQYEKLESDGACGYYPLRGLMKYCQEHNLKSKILDVRNSGDTAGSKDEVVGYGSYAFYE